MAVLWLTGKPSAGKTSIAQALKARVGGVNFEFLDGDVLRGSPLSEDLGFSQQDRARQARRVAFLAQRLNQHGVHVVVSLVSPMRAARAAAREIVGPGFFEVYVRCSSEVCQRRDVKGLYARAVRGELQGLTGYDAPYEEPENPEIVVDTEHSDLDACVQAIREAVGW